MTPFIAGCCQFEVTPGNVESNLEKVEKSLPDFAGKGCGLLVLPEMWSSGFDYPSLTRMAKKSPAVIDILSERARRYKMVLVGSLPELDDGKIYNTSYVIDSDGRLKGQYRKVHLFSLSREDDHFGRGVSPARLLDDVGEDRSHDLLRPPVSGTRTPSRPGRSRDPVHFRPMAGFAHRSLVVAPESQGRREPIVHRRLQRVRQGRQTALWRNLGHHFSDGNGARAGRSSRRTPLCRCQSG